MFGSTTKVTKLEEQVASHRRALRKIADHLGVSIAEGTSPESAADAICAKLDGAGQKARKERSAPGSESRPITGDVRRIKLAGALDIIVRIGDVPSMQVFANDTDDLTKVFTTVSGDCLTVDTENMTIVSNGNNVTQIFTGRFGGMGEKRTGPLGLRVEVTLPAVSILQISGAGNATYRDVDLDGLEVDVSGAGNIEVTGRVDRFEANVSGSGNVDAQQLVAKRARMRVSGAGNVDATATEDVVARVSGVGHINISGQPQSRDTDVSGIGKIRFIGG